MAICMDSLSDSSCAIQFGKAKAEKETFPLPLPQTTFFLSRLTPNTLLTSGSTCRKTTADMIMGAATCQL